MTIFLRWLGRIEIGIPVTLFAAMLSIAFLQIGIRNCESLIGALTSEVCSDLTPMLIWGDPMARLLVLWVALWGSMVAARSNRHIRIDAVTRFLPDPVERLVFRATSLISAAICIAVAWYTLEFVLIEFEDGFPAFAAIPAWLAQSIIPFAFLMMGVHLTLGAIWPPESDDTAP